MRKHRSLLTALSIVTICCAGCASAGYNAEPNLCPPLKSYSKDFVDRLANEIADLPHDTTLVTVVADYWVLRAQIRACTNPRQDNTKRPTSTP